MPATIPAAWLPQAAVPVTIVWTHPSYDATVQTVSCARDWVKRGENYLRKIADLDDDTVILAAFDGHLKSVLGCAINT